MLLFGTFLLWPFHQFLCHGFLPPSEQERCMRVSFHSTARISCLLLYAERVDGASGSAVVPTSSMKMSVSDGSTTSKRLMMPPCCSAASTIRLGLRWA